MGGDIGKIVLQVAIGYATGGPVGAALALATAVVGSLLAPKPPSANLGGFADAAQGRTQTLRQAITARRRPVGAFVCGTVLNYYAATSSKKYHHMVLLVCDGPIESFGTVWINDEPINPEDIDPDGTVNNGRFNGKVRLKFHLGTADQTADSDLIAEVADLDSNFRGRGIAYIYARIEWDRNILPNGLPGSIRAVVNAQETDPRTAITGFNDNAAVSWRGYVLDDTLGLAVHSAEASDIDTTAFTAAANVCDEIQDTNAIAATVEGVQTSDDTLELTDERCPYFTGDRVSVSNSNSPADLPAGLSEGTDYYAIVVNHARRDTGPTTSPVRIKLAATLADARAGTAVTITDAGTGTHTVTKDGEPRYRASGLIEVSETPHQIMTDLLSAMVGSAVHTGGKWVLLPGAWRPGTLTFDEGDLRGPVFSPTRHAKLERYNGVKGFYASPYNDGELTEYPVVKSSALLAADNNRREWDKFDQPFTAQPTQAQRNAAQRMKRHRTADIRFSSTFSPRALQARAGDVVLMTNARRGWSDYNMAVAAHGLDFEEQNEGGVLLRVRMELEATASTDFDWDPATEETDVTPTPRLTGTGIFDVSAPALGTLESGTDHLFLKADGTVVSRIYAPWTAVTDQLILGGGEVQLRFKQSVEATTEWQVRRQDDSSLNFLYLEPVEDGVQYDVQSRAVNGLGVASDWSATSTHTVVGKTAAPADVASLSAQQNGATVTFSWPQVADGDLAGYEIRYMTAPFVWANATHLTETTRGTRITTAAVPPSPTDTDGNQTPWVFGIKAVDTSGNESAAAATRILTVINAFDVITTAEQKSPWQGLGKQTLEFAVYTGRSYTASEVLNSRGVGFSDDGLKLFVLSGTGANSILYTYDLTAPWVVSTSSYSGVSLDISGLITDPRSFYFSGDGLSLFILSAGAFDRVYQYSLSTAWDISTASYASKVIAVAEESQPYGLTFNPSGTKMFVCGLTNNTVYQYTLSVAWDVSTASYDSIYFDASGDVALATSLAFSDDGLTLFLSAQDSIFEYELGVAFDLSIVSGPLVNFNVSSLASAIEGVFISSNAEVFFFLSSARKIFEYYYVNYLRNPLTGNINVKDLSLASEKNNDVFDNYVVNPIPSPVYETPEIDVGQDGAVRIWADIGVFLGAGETGDADVSLSVDYRSGAGEYDGFQDWSMAEVTTRFVKARISQDATNGAAVIEGFAITVDSEERSEAAEGVTIAPGGTTINFATPFFNTPNIQVTAEDASSPVAARHPVKSAVTGSGFTINVFDSGGNDVGGAVDWEAKGV